MFVNARDLKERGNLYVLNISAEGVGFLMPLIFNGLMRHCFFVIGVYEENICLSSVD